MPDIDYARLLAHLQEPGGVRIAEADLLAQLHHHHSPQQLDALGRKLHAERFIRSVNRIYQRLALASQRSVAVFRRLTFQISQAVLWLSSSGLPAKPNARERLLYSFKLTSEKFWRLRLVRPKPPEWEMSHGRIAVSESRRNVWDQKEAFQRMRNKLYAGYWESATTAGPDTPFDSIKHLYEDLLDTMLLEYQHNTQRHYATLALWYLLLERALPVREGLGLGDVTLGPTPPPPPGDGRPV